MVTVVACVCITNNKCWPQSALPTGDFTVNTQHLTTHQTQLYRALYICEQSSNDA